MYSPLGECEAAGYFSPRCRAGEPRRLGRPEAHLQGRRLTVRYARPVPGDAQWPRATDCAPHRSATLQWRRDDGRPSTISDSDSSTPHLHYSLPHTQEKFCPNENYDVWRQCSRRWAKKRFLEVFFSFWFCKFSKEYAYTTTGVFIQPLKIYA